MSIDIKTLASLDLDVFFNCGGMPMHIATFGALLPEELNDEKYIHSCHRHNQVQGSIYSVEDIEVNPGALEFLESTQNRFDMLMPIDERRQAYLRTFVQMARYGYYSYDRQHNMQESLGRDNEVSEYILVAYPKRVHNLPNIQALRDYDKIEALDVAKDKNEKLFPLHFRM